MIPPDAATAVALGLAVLDAACFGLAAVFQHRAVRRAVGRPALDLRPTAVQRRHHHGLGLRRSLGLFRRRSWLAGSGLVLLGGALHIVALALAPVSLIQPVGVLGVPIAVLAAAVLARHRPSAMIAVPIAGCVASIAGFVWLASGQDGGVPSTLGGLLVVEAVITALMIVFVLVSRRLHGWARCLSSALAGAVGLGLTSALIKAITDQLSHGPATLLTPVGIATIAGLALSAPIGGWLVQRAYASGPPEVVIACLTVVDPMVAVLIGFTVLGEGAALGTGVRTAMAVCGLLAAVSVVVLARDHPEARKRHLGDGGVPSPVAAVPAGYGVAVPTGSDLPQHAGGEPVAVGAAQPHATPIPSGTGKEPQ